MRALGHHPRHIGLESALCQHSQMTHPQLKIEEHLEFQTTLPRSNLKEFHNSVLAKHVEI